MARRCPFGQRRRVTREHGIGQGGGDFWAGSLVNAPVRRSTPTSMLAGRRQIGARRRCGRRGKEYGMPRRKTFLGLVTLLILMGLLMAPATTLAAETRIAISPGYGPPGTQFVIAVTGLLEQWRLFDRRLPPRRWGADRRVVLHGRRGRHDRRDVRLDRRRSRGSTRRSSLTWRAATRSSAATSPSPVRAARPRATSPRPASRSAGASWPTGRRTAGWR